MSYEKTGLEAPLGCAVGSVRLLVRPVQTLGDVREIAHPGGSQERRDTRAGCSRASELLRRQTRPAAAIAALASGERHALHRYAQHTLAADVDALIPRAA